MSPSGGPEELNVRAVLDAAPDGTVIIDEAGTIVYVNRRLCEMFACGEDLLIGRPIEFLVPPSARERHVGDRSRFQTHPHRRPMGVGLQLSAARPDGTAFPVEVSLSPLDSPNGSLVIASVRDITDRVEVEEALLVAHDSLLVADERSRIAQDLHDTVIQRIFAAGLMLQSSIDRPVGELRERALEIVDDLDQTIRELREAIFHLNQGQGIDDLETEVRRIVRHTVGSAAIDVRVAVTGDDSAVPTALRRELLPTLREAVSNIVRHADARHVVVALVIADTVRLEVRDDGHGIAPGAVDGRGLVNLRSRAARLGGTCRVDSTVDLGTTVIWQAPLS